MAESKGGGFGKLLQKRVGRTKEKVLQNLGKADKTTDDVLDEHIKNFNDQQTSATRLQKELKNYLTCARAMAAASKTFFDAVAEVYESEWSNHEAVVKCASDLEMLWADYLRKLNEDVQNPLNNYLNIFPDVKTKLSKRNRKLVDFDGARHSFESLQHTKKRDETKIGKADDELKEARRIYQDINNELHDELPSLHDDRIAFLVSNFRSLSSAETIFHTETAKVNNTVAGIIDQLDAENEENKYKTAKPTRASTNSLEDKTPSPTPASQGSGLSTFFDVAVPDAEPKPSHQNNGSDAAEHNKNSETETNKTDTKKPTTEETSESPTTEPAAAVVAKVTTNGEVGGDEEPSRVVSATSDDVYEPVNVGAQLDKIPAAVAAVAAVESDKPEVRHETPVAAAIVVEKMEEVVKEIEKEVPAPARVPTPTDDVPPALPAVAAPPPAASVATATGELANEVKTTSEAVYSIPGDTDDIYKVPPSNELVKKLPAGVLYQVRATHPYSGEDSDELSFEPGEIINVVPFDDPEDQDEGWLMGVRVSDGQKGVFPGNFTKPID